MAANRAYMSCEKLKLNASAYLHSRVINPTIVHGVIEAPGGAWFTECPPNYPHNKTLQKHYTTTTKNPAA